MKARLLVLVALLFPFAAAAQMVPCVDGFAGNYACQNVDLLAQPTTTGATDIWGWTDPQTGVEYAIIFVGGRTSFYDLSDPVNPVLVARLAATAGKDARTYDDHLFVVDDGGLPGMLVFDLGRLRDVANPPANFEADAVYTGLSRAHNLSMDPESGFAFAVAVGSTMCQGELHIVDVREPLNPVFAGCYEDPSINHFHDAQCLTYDGPDSDHTGRELCFGSAGTNGLLVIVDVTDKANPVAISEAPYPDFGYTHQGWLTEDRRYFLLNDEFDESNFGIHTRTIVFDVSDLDNPQVAFEHFAETTSTDHNLFVKGDYMYQANYSAGFRLLDLSGIDDGTLSEVAFFDTTPSGGSGAWGVYPFFDSGIVIVSDLGRGLFVLQPHLTPVDAEGGAPDRGFRLAAYPNPLGDRATVSLTVEAAQHVRVAVYDVLGREVARLHDGLLSAERTFDLDASALPAGTYFLRVVGETAETTRPITVTR